MATVVDRGARPELGPGRLSASQLQAFTRFCEGLTRRRFASHSEFHDFSVSDYREFWWLFLSWSEILWDGPTDPVCTSDECERARFFPNVSLNYAENLLRIDSPADGDRVAVTAQGASGGPERLTRRELRDRVLRVARRLRGLGVGPGDRVAAVSANDASTVVAGLASAAVGAPFATAAPEMAAPAVLGRLEQVEPKVLFASLDDGDASDPGAASDRVGAVARGLPSLAAVIATDDGPAPPGLAVPVHRLSELAAGHAEEAVEEDWERFPFDHPLFILFTSGTTGRPKCVVHGAGGTLLEHLKEHRLHLDLRPSDRLFFHTSTAWMMWHWQLSALASGSAIVLYDGAIERPDTLWRLVSTKRVTVFGTSPPYLRLCQDAGLEPARDLELVDLRSVLSTGSILHDWQYDWVQREVGQVQLQSISGGTDIIGCFVLGHPDLPVRRGWIQSRSLGLDVQALPSAVGSNGSRIGELVCRNPFPSRPLGILGDEDGTRFHESYFAQNPGAWTHGDLIEIDEDGQARMHGRSDGVLNVRGVRIGPAEIYRALFELPEVTDAMAVEQRAAEPRGEPRVVLLVVLRSPAALDGRLTVRIRQEIARRASPLHVPDLIVQVDELPTTHSGKRSECAGRAAANGEPGTNSAALRNPGSLEAIRGAVARAARRQRALAEDASSESAGATTEERVRAIWESVLGVAPLRPTDRFPDLGGTSLAAVRIFQAIHDRLGVDLPVSTLLHAETTAALARLIDGPVEDWIPPVVLLRAGSGGPPLFVAHGVDGDVLLAASLVQRLRTDRPVYGIRARGLAPRESPETRIEEMAESYIGTIQSVQPRGPYALAGYSFGGLVAYEMARRLTRLGERVEWLGLIDAELHHGCLPRRRRLGFQLVRPLRFLRATLAAPTTMLPRYARKAARRLAPRARIAPPEPEFPAAPLQRRLEGICRAAFDEYRPRPYSGSATLFLADSRFPGRANPLPAWRRLIAGELTVEGIPGRHLDSMHEPGVGELAARFNAHLA